MRAKPKKNLGQNFLVDGNIQRKIISHCELNDSDVVVEIGPGRGELTKLIAPRVKMLYAIEKDSLLVKDLREYFKESKNVAIIQWDVLKFDFKGYFRDCINLKVIGNIPYYITTPIIEYLFNLRDKIDVVFITVQKEFALRLSALPGSREVSSLSYFARYYSEPKILFTINKGCFFPVPKVDSTLVRLKIRKEAPFHITDERLFFKIIRAAFNKRRKTLKNSLNGIVHPEILGDLASARPEDLSLQDFVNLANS